jgi:exosortase O
MVRPAFTSGLLARGPLQGNLLILAIWGAWLWLFGPTLRWLAHVSTAHAHYRVGLALSGGLAALLIFGAWRARRAGSLLRRAPAPRPAPLALLGGAAVLYVIQGHLIRIHSLGALLMGLATYGLIGLWLRPAAFRRGLPLALLLCALLPFGAQANTLVGMAARVLTAEVTAAVLAAQGVTALSAQAVLVLDTGIAHVDDPCSGLRSLWAGALFFLGASFVMRRAPGLRWLLCGALLAGALLIANIARVCAIVILCHVWQMRALAEVLHEPIGVLGFAAACGAGWAALRLVPAISAQAAEEAAGDAPASGQRILILMLLCALSVLALLRGPQPLLQAAEPGTPAVALPASLQPQDLPLTAAERTLLQRFGAGAKKWRFRHGEISGSLIVVAATSWRAQHPPELCLSAAGLRIEGIEVGSTPGFPVRRLRLRGVGGPQTGLYWFQSRSRTTADFLTRALLPLGAAGRDERWVMVSVLLDRADDNPRRADGLLGAVHQAVAAALAEEGVERR